MNVNDFHNIFRIVAMISGSKFVQCPRMILNSGLHMSVQASEYHYSEPRISDYDHYYSFEIGFPSEKIETIMDYVEDADRPTETVYAYVPASVIDDIIKSNGGINLQKMIEAYVVMYNQTYKTSEKPKPKKEIVEFNAKGYSKEEILELLKAIKE